MATATKTTSYRERLDIHSLDIEEVKDLIKNNIRNTLMCWESGFDVDKQTFHIIGPAGVGKTSSAYQIADELSKEVGKEFNVIKIQSPVLSRDDLLCPFPSLEDRKFKMLLSDFIPVDKDSFGLFVIDEFSRGDHNLQQLMWQIMNEQSIHTYKFPKGWFVICLDNPDDESYTMNYIEDAAGLRRSCHMYCDVSLKAFLKYAYDKNYHPVVIEFIESNPNMLYDHEALRMGRVYANPASWERVSNMLHGYDISNAGDIGDGVAANINKIEMAVSGLLNASMARVFADYAADNSNTIKSEDIFKNYKSVRNKIKKMTKESNNPRLASVMSNFMNWLATTKPVLDANSIKNVKDFLLDIPVDIATIYFTTANELKDSNFEAFIYITNLQVSLVADKNFKEKFYEPIVEISKKALKDKLK